MRRLFNVTLTTLTSCPTIKSILNNIMTDLIEKPTKPADDDCCGGGCTPCVWDTFYDQLSMYRKQQRALAAKEESSNT